MTIDPDFYVADTRWRRNRAGLVRIPVRIVCQRCGEADPDTMDPLEVAAMNRILAIGQSTRVNNRCVRIAPDRNARGGRLHCGGKLVVEP